MFKLEIPGIFLVANCVKCRMKHAPIRDCIDSEGNVMYFDAVLIDGSRMVAFNGTPEQTKEYLYALPTDRRENLTVVCGKTLETFAVDDYLNK